jgi:hypothetical protein
MLRTTPTYLQSNKVGMIEDYGLKCVKKSKAISALPLVF